MECKCESCIRENCQDRTKQDDLQIVINCDYYLERKPTNADRIRSMSDEELANVLTDFSNNGGWVTETGREICYERHIEWLQQPAE